MHFLGALAAPTSIYHLVFLLSMAAAHTFIQDQGKLKFLVQPLTCLVSSMLFHAVHFGRTSSSIAREHLDGVNVIYKPS